MPRKSEVIEELNWVTERISSRVWTISIGMIAMSLAYVIESTRSDGAPFLEPRQVALPATIALLALVADMFQYVAANHQNVLLLRRMENEGLSEAKYHVTDFAGRMRSICYTLKVSLCILAVIVMLSVMAVRIVEVIGWKGS